MKILVLGGTGMAGHTIAIYLKEQGHEISILSRREVQYCKYIISDVKDLNGLEQLIVEGNYDAIINCIGLLNDDAEDNKADAVLLNSFLPHFLAEKTKEKKTKIIHMSTDCVFLGRKGQYVEHSFKDGPSFYDRSKALGEIINSKDLTFRNSIIGPDLRTTGIGLFNWFMKQQGLIDGYTKAIWTGVTTLTLAKAMEAALDQDLVGLYHLVNNEIISKFELLKLFNKYFKNNKIDICSSEKVALDKSLINSRDDFAFKVPSYEKMIVEMKEWIYNHKELYPHYFN